MVAGCTHWVAQDQAPAQVLAERGPDRIHVTTRDGRVFLLANPAIAHDTLSGVLPGTATAGQPLRRFTMPVADVKAISIQQRSVSRTLSLVVLLPGAVAGSLYLLAF